MSARAWWCRTCSWERSETDGLMLRLYAHRDVETLVRCWSRGHDVGCSPGVFSVVRAAALRLAARRRGLA